jgi:hypothetical protein
MIVIAAVIGAFWLSTIDERRNRPQVNPVPEVPHVPTAPDTTGLPTNPTFRRGAQVELIGPKEFGMPTICADERIFLEFRSHTRKFVAGEEVFGVDISALAEVLLDKGDRVQVKILEGAWKDRVGWIAPDEVRLRPTPEEAARDIVDGLPLDRRREIYAELHRIGMLAAFEGSHQIPIVGDGDTFAERNAKLQALSADLEKKGRVQLITKYKQYKIDMAQLDRIDKEGIEKRWPMPHVVDPYKR